MRRNIYIVVLLLLISASCSNKQKEFKLSGEAQGTFFHITYFGEKDYSEEIDSLLSDFDLIASIYNKKSIISKINQNDSTIKLNEIFLDIFNLGMNVSKQTDGAFDMSIGPLVNAWGFGPEEAIAPDSTTIDSLLKLINYKQIQLVDNTIIKDNPNIKLDFNAIAKGYAVDLVGDFLSSKKIESYLVEIGGEIVTKGQKPNGDDWIVGIEMPAETANAPQQPQSRISVSNMAVATSGNYRNYYEQNGERFAHTINPKTGYPVQHSLLSVTVIAENCATADAYATAFMVLGKEKALEITEEIKNLEIYLIYYNNKTEKNETIFSSGFEKYIFD
jgi:FAD:protein FMN transferase